MVGPRILLRQLREVMALPVAPQTRLDRIVVMIAGNMVAEVCSIYLIKPGDRLELFATEGLNPQAVHETRLKVGEGLVGVIAANADPLNLADAQAHPAYVYRPETGEEVYHAFLGVPILRAGHILGVLVVQNKASRLYSEEEVEALQTAAMVLAEVVASGEFLELSAVEDDIGHVRAHKLDGEAICDGIGMGTVVLHEPRVTARNLIAEDTDQENKRLREAILELRHAVDQMFEQVDIARFGEHRDVLEAYRMFAHDRGWARKMHEAIETGLTAEAAVERVQSDNRARMMRSRDPYIRERLHDFDDLANRLLRHLTGREATAAEEKLPKNAILIARYMGPAELLDYDRTRLRGLVLEEGTQNSHVAIVARALDIATVGQVPDAIDLVDPGDQVIVDGDMGEVHIRPSDDIIKSYRNKVRSRARRQARYAKLRDLPALTKDGQRVRLGMNAGLLVDLPHLAESGADGIFLFRTELQFMIASKFPRIDEQTDYYGAVLEAAQGKPVVFRSLDIGGDKLLPYLAHAKEKNPALGWRALRMALDRPALLRLQLRGLLRAAAGSNLDVMFPMVSESQEFARAKALVDKEANFLTAHGHELPREIRLGIMLEVPAMIWQLDEIANDVDFVSIGSNDLLQFLFASDRENPALAHRYDPLSAVVLRVLRQVVETCARHAVPVTLCGEMAGRPLEAMALIGLGLRSISMDSAAIGPVKEMLGKLDAGRLEGELLAALDKPNGSLRPLLKQFAKAHKLID
jgi:phosphotransferase system enzyme I (PtsP)